MYKVGFDNNKYLQMQSERIKERINEFGGKLYLEFGGKLFAIITHQEFCRDFSLTASFKCFFSLKSRQK